MEDLIEHLNQDCFCIELEKNALLEVFRSSNTTEPFVQEQLNKLPQFFASYPVFVSKQHLKTIASTVGLLHRVVNMEGFKQAVLETAPSIAYLEDSLEGVFFGYDFHLGDHGPQLIEINTNAGGGLVNAYLDNAYRLCCEAVNDYIESTNTANVMEQYFDMFLHEWSLFSPGKKLKTVAIVDESPEKQFLFPEFLLFQNFFEQRGIHAIICDPSELTYNGVELVYKQTKIDFLYNRLTDFYFETPQTQEIAQAYRDKAVAISPNPRTHALFANKKNLVLLSDEQFLRSLPLCKDERELLLDVIPSTFVLRTEDESDFWGRRKEFFFKPASGYGSKGTYRGAKLSKKKWAEILKQGDFIAQSMVPPSNRSVLFEGKEVPLKLDLRAFSYQGKVQLYIARLYNGQTTNFRTPGGGFAGVFTARKGIV